MFWCRPPSMNGKGKREDRRQNDAGKVYAFLKEEANA